MKKHILLLFLIFTGFLQAQTYPVNPTKFGKISLNTNGVSTSTTKINTQEADGQINYIDAMNLPVPTSVINAIKQKADLSTGLLKNGLISINTDPTKFNISAGIGIISNFDDPENPVSTIISFPAFTGVTPTYLLTGNITYIAINSTPAVVMQATPFTDTQRRDLIILGAAVHSNLTNINVVNNISAPSNAIGNQLHDFMEAVGALNITGNKYSANGANLSLNKSAGTIFKFGVNFATNWKDPHVLSQSSGTALTFRYRTQNGTEGSDVTVINPALYDVANVLTAVPNNKFSIQTVTMFQTGLTRIQYGQNVYDDLASAQAAIFTRDYNVEANIKENGITRAYIIVKNNATSLQNATDSRIIEAQKFGGVASGGVALTFANIVSALGYTPENVANKSDSFTASSSTTYASTKALVDGLGVNNVAIAYVESTGNNATAIAGNQRKPYLTIEAALDALPSTGGVIKIGIGTFQSPDKTKIKANCFFLGSGKPFPNMTVTYADETSEPTYSSPTKLVGGTILTGNFYIDKVDNVQVSDLGIDCGKDFIDTFRAGVTEEGLTINGVLTSANNNNTMPPIKGIRIYNVSSLNYSATAPRHAVLVQDGFDITFNNISTYFGVHGIALKGRNVNLSNAQCFGHDIDGIIIKSDKYSYASDVSVNNVFITSIGSYDGAGIIVESGGDVIGGTDNRLYRVNISNANIRFTKFGIIDLGSVSKTDNINISDLNVYKVSASAVYFRNNSKNISLSNINVDGVASGNAVTLISNSPDEVKSLTNCVVKNSNGVGQNGFFFNAVGGKINLSNVYSSDSNIAIDGGSTSNVTGFNVRTAGTITGTLYFDANTTTDNIPSIDANGLIKKSLATVSPLGGGVFPNGVSGKSLAATFGASDTVGSGSFLALTNGLASTSGRQMVFQLSAANDVTNFYFNGTTFAATGIKFKNTGKIEAVAGTASNDVVVRSQLDLKADLASPALTGTPTAPTATAGTNTAQLATTAFVQAASRPYKTWVGIITQSGTSAPTAVVLENNLGGTIVWTRSSTGLYIGTLAGLLTTNKTVGFATLTPSRIANKIAAIEASGTMQIATADATGTALDSVLANTPFEIRVYP